MYPNPSLRTKSDPITEFDNSLRKLADGMLVAMRKAHGIGLAANQVGVGKRVILVEINPGVIKERAKSSGIVPLQALVNPQIFRASSDTAVSTEACLSLPKVEVEVERPHAVKVKAQNLSGKPITISAKGLYARVLQHEIDHINGVLIIDYARKSKFQSPNIKSSSKSKIPI